MTPDNLQRFQFSGPQKAIHGSIALKSGELAELYEAALRAWSDLENPCRLRLAAHVIRELADGLPKAFDLPIPVDPAQITKQVDPLEQTWTEAAKSKCHQDGAWKGDIDEPVRQLLRKFNEFFEWLKKNRPKRRLVAIEMFRSADPAGKPLPEQLEQSRVQKWLELRRYFSNTAHGSVTTEDEFATNFQDLERILVSSLFPQPSEDLSEIDRILAEGA